MTEWPDKVNCIIGLKSLPVASAARTFELQTNNSLKAKFTKFIQKSLVLLFKRVLNSKVSGNMLKLTTLTVAPGTSRPLLESSSNNTHRTRRVKKRARKLYIIFHQKDL